MRISSLIPGDRAAVKAEAECLKPLLDLGGYIPCPDHRIVPDTEWANSSITAIYYGRAMPD